MERKIYEAPEAEVFVLEFNRMLDISNPVKNVGDNLGDDGFTWGGSSDKDTSGRGAMSKDRGSDDFDWDLGF